MLFVFNPRTRASRCRLSTAATSTAAARNLAAALGVLHESNYIVGDLNESNVLVTPSAMVTLIDVDSFQVQEPRNGRIIVYAPHVGKLEYTPWELQGHALGEVLRQTQHDDFALGVLMFQMLMEGNHPFRARWLRPGDRRPIEERIRQGWFPYDRPGRRSCAHRQARRRWITCILAWWPFSGAVSSTVIGSQTCAPALKIGRKRWRQRKRT